MGSTLTNALDVNRSDPVVSTDPKILAANRVNPDEPAFLTRGLHSSQECNLAQDFPLQGVLVTEGRSRNTVQGSMCALKRKRQARARPAPSVL